MAATAPAPVAPPAVPPPAPAAPAPAAAAPAAPVERPGHEIAAERARKAAQWRRDQSAKADRLGHNLALKEREAVALAERVKALEPKPAPPLSVEELAKANPYEALKLLEDQRKADAKKFDDYVAKQETDRQAIESAKVEAKAELDLIEFVKVKSADAFPHLSRQPDRVVLTLVRSLLHELSQKTNPDTGQPAHVGVGFKDCCEYLEQQYGLPIADRDTPEKSLTSVESGAAGKKATGERSKTLTSDLGDTKTTLPVDFDKMSDAQQRRAFAEMLRANGKAR